MRPLSFSWQENASLAAELAAGIDCLYVRTAAHGAPISITLWKGEHSGLEIRSKMHDIGKRLEIGVLEFTKVRTIRISDVRIDIRKSFNEHLKVEKLLIVESDVTAESGITLENSSGEQIVIVAGANPYTLSIRAPAVGTEFQPEYPLDRYRHVLMT
jgi:hypothetical protein